VEIFFMHGLVVVVIVEDVLEGFGILLVDMYYVS
jgi:hypothetical protein